MLWKLRAVAEFTCNYEQYVFMVTCESGCAQWKMSRLRYGRAAATSTLFGAASKQIINKYLRDTPPSVGREHSVRTIAHTHAHVSAWPQNVKTHYIYAASARAAAAYTYTYFT